MPTAMPISPKERISFHRTRHAGHPRARSVAMSRLRSRSAPIAPTTIATSAATVVKMAITMLPTSGPCGAVTATPSTVSAAATAIAASQTLTRPRAVLRYPRASRTGAVASVR